MSALNCNHEEADTRLILHASHASMTGHNAVCICSPDTDVAVIATAHSFDIPATIVFLTGTKNRRRFINLTQVGRSLGRELCLALPGYHAFTGCDTTSAFAGKGKVAPLELLNKNESFCTAMQLIGKSFDSNIDVLFKKCQPYVCKMYSYHDVATDINTVRYSLFCARAAESAQLSPTQDALKMHIKRANYQAGIWRRAMEASPDIPSFHNQGWQIGEDNEVTIEWMTKPPAPVDVLKLISCSCKTGCSSKRCSCQRSCLPCTDVCQCDNCENPIPREVLQPASTIASANEFEADNFDANSSDEHDE